MQTPATWSSSTPCGPPAAAASAGGALADVHPVDLLAQTLQALLERNPAVDPGTVDDVIIGCVSQVGEQSATPGRMAWLGAGFPEHVPATTIDRKCGSSQQAVHFAAQGISSGEYDVVVAGGVESMSRVVMGSARMGADPYGAMRRRSATRPGWSPRASPPSWSPPAGSSPATQLDEYSAALPRPAPPPRRRPAPSTARSSRSPRPTASSTATRRSAPAPPSRSSAASRRSSRPPSSAARFPEIDWTVTAGNSSQITDGASALLIMSRGQGRRARAAPRAPGSTPWPSSATTRC